MRVVRRVDHYSKLVYFSELVGRNRSFVLLDVACGAAGRRSESGVTTLMPYD